MTFGVIFRAMVRALILLTALLTGNLTTFLVLINMNLMESAICDYLKPEEKQ